MTDVMTLQCNHSYCGECITTWLRDCDDRCPHCRAPAVSLTRSDGTDVVVPDTQTREEDLDVDSFNKGATQSKVCVGVIILVCAMCVWHYVCVRVCMCRCSI